MTARVRRLLPLWLGVALALVAPVAAALETTISARYRGGANGKFENTTPIAEYCGTWMASCTNKTVVDVPITYVKEVTMGGPRDRYYIKPPERKRLDIYHETTGESFELEFEVQAVSQMVANDDWLVSPVYSGDLQGGCTRRTSARPGVGVQFLWTYPNPASPQPCWSISRRVPADAVVVTTASKMGISYLLTTPQPYQMKPGMYHGTLDLTLGPGGDFDFGNAVSQLNDNSLRINFELDVRHLFLLSFPPGSDRAVLEPEGGWTAWLNGGRVPQRLYRDLPMRVWSTGPLKVYKLCDYDMGDRCGIRNEKKEGVPVHVLLTLPEGVRYRGGPVQRLKIPTGPAAAVQLESVMPTINRPGQLHFEVKRDDVVPMFNRPGMTYSGKVTLVFDAEL